MSSDSSPSTVTLLPKRSPAWGFALLVGLLAMVAVGKVVLSDTLDPDSFWHLRVAEQIAQRGWPGPLVDRLSFASKAAPWVPYSWLAELAMKRLWDAGGYRAVVAAQAVIEGLFVIFVALATMEATRIAVGRTQYFASALATAAAAVLSLAYLSFRPVTAVILILALIGWLLLRDRRLLQKSKAVWLIPPIAALATNFHFFAIFIPLWALALFVGDAIENRRASVDKGVERRRVLRGAILAMLSLIGFLMTPLLSGTLRSMANYSFSDVMVRSTIIAEMQPFYHGLMGWVSAALVLFLAICVIRNYTAQNSTARNDAAGQKSEDRKSLGLGELIWLIGSGLLLFRYGRMAPIFALIGAPWFAVAMPKMSDRVLAKTAVLALIGIVLAAGTARIAGAFPRTSESLSAWLNRHGPGFPAYPCGAADYVQANVPPASGRLICEFPWGGYLEWRLGDHFQTLMDGRTQVFSADFWKDAYFGSADDRRKLLESARADAAIVPRERSEFLQTLQEMKWRKVYEDDFAEVLVPPVPRKIETSN